MQLDNLPSITYEDRAALNDSYVANGCVPTGTPLADSPTFERWRNQVLLDAPVRT